MDYSVLCYGITDCFEEKKGDLFHSVHLPPNAEGCVFHRGRSEIQKQKIREGNSKTYSEWPAISEIVCAHKISKSSVQNLHIRFR